VSVLQVKRTWNFSRLIRLKVFVGRTSAEDKSFLNICNITFNFPNLTIECDRLKIKK